MYERCFFQHARLHVSGVIDKNVNITVYLECFIDSGFDLLVRLVVIESKRRCALGFKVSQA